MPPVEGTEPGHTPDETGFFQPIMVALHIGHQD
jgi:hypothetical protein